MKSIIFIYTFLLLSINCLCQTNWEATYGTIDLSHNDISFVNPNTGFAAGYVGTGSVRILQTTNKGVNWFFSSPQSHSAKYI